MPILENGILIMYFIKILRWLAIFLAVSIVSIAGFFLVFSFDLIVHEAVSNSLTMLAMGLLQR